MELLGIEAQVGRLIKPEDPGSAPYFVLSDSLGTTVRLNKDAFTIIGVAPPQFRGTERFVWPDYYMPAVNYFRPAYLQDRTGRPFTVLARLSPGISPQQASASNKFEMPAMTCHLAVARRSGRFGFAAAGAAEEHREYDKDLRAWRCVGDAE